MTATSMASPKASATRRVRAEGILADTLVGGDGGDFLSGRLGADVRSGGINNDRFDFNAIADSKPGRTRDVIDCGKEIQRGGLTSRTDEQVEGEEDPHRQE